MARVVLAVVGAWWVRGGRVQRRRRGRAIPLCTRVGRLAVEVGPLQHRPQDPPAAAAAVNTPVGVAAVAETIVAVGAPVVLALAVVVPGAAAAARLGVVQVVARRRQATVVLLVQAGIWRVPVRAST